MSSVPRFVGNFMLLLIPVAICFGLIKLMFFPSKELPEGIEGYHTWVLSATETGWGLVHMHFDGPVGHGTYYSVGLDTMNATHAAAYIDTRSLALLVDDIAPYTFDLRTDEGSHCLFRHGSEPAGCLLPATSDPLSHDDAVDIALRHRYGQLSQ